MSQARETDTAGVPISYHIFKQLITAFNINISNIQSGQDGKVENHSTKS